MTLLEDEVKLDSLKDSVVLTNYRIMQEIGKSYKISIFLEKISSVVVSYKSKPLFLIFGIFFLLAGYVVNTQLYYYKGEGILSLIVGVIFILLFFFSRKHVLSISPDGGKSLDFGVKWTKKERIEDFITKIQKAQLARSTVK